MGNEFNYKTEKDYLVIEIESCTLLLERGAD